MEERHAQAAAALVECTMATDADKKTETLNLETRRDLANAHAFLLGQQSVQSFAALTPEELYDQQIERIEGKDTDTRPNELHRLDQLESSLLKTVEKVKALPPEVFVEPNETTDVNTSTNVPEQ